MKQDKQIRKPVKILRVQSRIVVGGPALHTILLSKKFNAEGFQTILVGGANNSDEKSMVEVVRQQNIDCIVIPEMGREIHFFDDIISLIKLYRLIKREKPVIFHSHTAKAGAIGRIAAFLAGVPYICHTFHGHVFEGYFGPFKSKLFVLVERLLACISTCTIVISEKQKFDIVEKYRITTGERVKVVPLGFEWNATFFDNELINLRERFNIPVDKFLIGIVGRIVPIKDHHLFVEIANRLIELDKSKFHFIVIGNGELRGEIETLVNEKKIQENFTFSGWLQVNEMVYKSMDLLLLTSKNEGTPVAVIEALAAGIPVVARDVGGVQDVLKHYDLKYLVKGNDPGDYISLIVKLTSDYHLVPEKVRKKIINYFSEERLVQDIKQLYLTMMNTE